jgi:hypothetical protein
MKKIEEEIGRLRLLRRNFDRRRQAEKMAVMREKNWNLSRKMEMRSGKQERKETRRR